MKIKLPKWLVWAIRIVLGLAMLMLVALFIAIYAQDIEPLAMAQIRERSDLLNDAASVVVPHTRLDEGVTRAAHLALFEKVERLEELTEAESIAYREVYQDLLFRKQGYLRQFDGNMAVMADVDMDRPNNVGGHGIAGTHDHHDQSSRSNAADVAAALARIESAPDGVISLAKVRAAVDAYKDVSDILLHLGTVPQTKSTAYSPSLTEIPGKVGELSEEVLKEFKKAQFAPVNSAAYWESVHRALDRYDELVFEVQSRINAELSPFERRLAGRWGGLQSVGPSFFKGYPEPRRPRP